MPPNIMSDTQRILGKTIKFQNLCPQCSGWVSHHKKKYSGAIYITEEADIQGRTIDTIFCEDKKDSWCQ
jgi:hypothetical protein